MNQDLNSVTYGIGGTAISAQLGEYYGLVEAALDSWDRQDFSRLMWDKNPTPWKQPVGTPEIVDRLGWMNVVDTMINRVEELTGFAQEVKDAGITSVVVLGMGGSSLSPEVSYLTFGSKPGFPRLFVLDSTVPRAVLDIEAQIELSKTLFVVSSKSGGTIETKSAYKYFYDKLPSGGNFTAITDPSSWLQGEGEAKGFRRVFLNMPDIGGRYSALSYFGLVPAALIGVDVAGLLRSARKMFEACGPELPARNNPGVALGAIMAECALRGRDKMTLLFSPEIRSFGYWVEQLVAESTGKHGQGVLPIESEAVGDPSVYSNDRLFVSTRLKGEAPDPMIDALAAAGHPVVTIEIENLLDLGQEYFRWEIATAVASALLAVNAFDQPNVASSKKITGELIEQYKQKQTLPAQTKLAEDGLLTVYADDATAEVLNGIRENGPYPDVTVESIIDAQLRRFEPGDYIALMAFTNRTEEVEAAMETVRMRLRDACMAATTSGYGPRFLHSTGQFHKGGPNTGLFIQITTGDPVDVAIPGEVYSFGILKDAQAMGDFISLRDKGCRALRIHLADLESGYMALTETFTNVLKKY